MTETFYTIIPKQSNDELLEYINNYKQYSKEAIELAITELIRRGKHLSGDELSKIRKEISERDLSWKKTEEEDADLFYPDWNMNIVTDSSAPELYSRHAICAFSFILSTLFGAILLAINLKNIGNTKSTLPIIACGIVITVVSIILINYSTDLTMVINFIGAYLLYSYFWKRYIGRDTKYRARPIWVPLLIGFILNLPILIHLIKNLGR